MSTLLRSDTAGNLLRSAGGNLVRALEDAVCPDPCGGSAPSYFKLTLTDPMGMTAEIERSNIHTWDEDVLERPFQILLPRNIRTDVMAHGEVYVPAGVYHFMFVTSFQNDAGVVRAAFETRDLSSLVAHGNTYESKQQKHAESSVGGAPRPLPTKYLEAGGDTLSKMWLVIELPAGSSDWEADGIIRRITVRISGKMREGVQTLGSIDWDSPVAAAWDSIGVFRFGLAVDSLNGTVNPSTDQGCGYLAYDREDLVVGYGERINPENGESGPSDPWPPDLLFFSSQAIWDSQGSMYVKGTLEIVSSLGSDSQSSTLVRAQPTYGATGSDVKVDIANRTSDVLSHPRNGATRYALKPGTLTGVSTQSATWQEGYPDWVYRGETDTGGDFVWASDVGRTTETTFTYDSDVYDVTGEKMKRGVSATPLSVTWGGTASYPSTRKVYEVCEANSFPSHFTRYKKNTGVNDPHLRGDIWAGGIPPCHTARRVTLEQITDPGGWLPELYSSTANLVDGCTETTIPTYTLPSNPFEPVEFAVRICLPEDDTNNGGCGGSGGFGDGEGGECTTEKENLGLCGDNDPDADGSANGRGEAGGDLNSGSPFDDGPLGNIQDQCDYYPNPHPLRPCFCDPPPTEPYIDCPGDPV